MRKVSQLIAAASLLACLASPLTGQNAPATQPSTRPSTVPAAVAAEQMLDRMLQTKPGMAQPLQPIEPSVETRAARREGQLIRQRVGRLVRDEAQGPVFALEADGTSLQDPPLGILAGEELEKMEEAVKKASRDLRFRITGTVTTYRGRNYILIERAEIAPDLARPQ
jgi:hypothetical protein